MGNLEKWQHYMRDIESPNQFIDWGFVHLVSSALQRRVWMYSDPMTYLPGSMSLFPNLFTILVGPPSTGKGRVILQEMSIVKHSQLQRVDASGTLKPMIPYAPDTTTQEALIQSIAQCIKPTTIKLPDGTKKAYSHSSCVFLVEELEVLMRKNTEDIVNMLNKLYDSGDYHYKTKGHGEDKILNVCVNIMAGTTPEGIRNLISTRIIGTGFTSRVIFVYAPAPRFYRAFEGLDQSQQQAYNDVLGHVKNLANVVGEVRLSPDALRYYKDVYESGKLLKDKVNTDHRLEYYYGRKRVHWLKLSMGFHYFDQVDSNIIEQPTLEKTLNFLNSTEVDMHEVFRGGGRNVLHDTALQIHQYLTINGPTSFRKLWFKFSCDVKKTEFDECIDFLLQTHQVTNNSGMIAAKIKPTNGEHKQ
jgi:Protein of unknown function (DUF3987)